MQTSVRISIMTVGKTPRFSPKTSHRHCSCNDGRSCKAKDSQLALLHQTFLTQSTVCKDSVGSWRVKAVTVSLDRDPWCKIDRRRTRHPSPQEIDHRRHVVTIETKRRVKLTRIRTRQWTLRNLPLIACYSAIRPRKVSPQVSKFKTSRFNRLTTRCIIAIWITIQILESSKCYCHF